MFCHVPHAHGAYSGARSGMTPSSRAGAPGIPPCSGARLFSAWVLPFEPVSVPLQACGGTLFARVSCVRARARRRASCAGAVRAPDCARETTDTLLPSPPAGAFLRAPAALRHRKAERRPPGAASLFSSYHTFPQSQIFMRITSDIRDQIANSAVLPGRRRRADCRRSKDPARNAGPPSRRDYRPGCGTTRR